MELSKRIKSEREKKKISQDVLAEQLHVSRQAISKWETGQSYPDLDKLVQLSEFFNITIDELVKGDAKLKEELIKGGKGMSGLAILSYVLLLLGIITIFWGGSQFPINLMNSEFMSFVVGGLVLMTIGAVLLPAAPLWLRLGMMWLMTGSILLYLIGFFMPLWDTLSGIVVILGLALWFHLLISGMGR